MQTACTNPDRQPQQLIEKANTKTTREKKITLKIKSEKRIRKRKIINLKNTKKRVLPDNEKSDGGN